MFRIVASKLSSENCFQRTQTPYPKGDTSSVDSVLWSVKPSNKHLNLSMDNVAAQQPMWMSMYKKAKTISPGRNWIGRLQKI